MNGILSRFGVGAAEVDTVLPTDSVIAGETVEATVEIHGGDSAQDVEAVYFALLTRHATDDGRSTGVVDRHRLADSFTIEAGEERSFEVDLGIPRDAPATLDRTDVWIETGLDVEWAVDPDDSDPIEIRPDAHLGALLDALDALGFALRRADCEAASTGSPGVGSPRRSSSARVAVRSTAGWTSSNSCTNPPTAARRRGSRSTGAAAS